MRSGNTKNPKKNTLIALEKLETLNHKNYEIRIYKIALTFEASIEVWTSTEVDRYPLNEVQGCGTQRKKD